MFDLILLPDVSQDEDIQLRQPVVEAIAALNTQIQAFNATTAELARCQMLLSIQTAYQTLLLLLHKHYQGWQSKAALEQLYFSDFIRSLEDSKQAVAQALYDALGFSTLVDEFVVSKTLSMNDEKALMNSINEPLAAKPQPLSLTELLTYYHGLQQIAPTNFKQEMAPFIHNRLLQGIRKSRLGQIVLQDFNVQPWQSGLAFIPKTLAITEQRKWPAFFYANHNFAVTFVQQHSATFMRHLAVLEGEDWHGIITSLNALDNLLKVPAVKGIARWFNPHKQRQDFLKPYQQRLRQEKIKLYERLVETMLEYRALRYPATYEELVNRDETFKTQHELVTRLQQQLHPEPQDTLDLPIRLINASIRMNGCQASDTSCLHVGIAENKEWLLEQLDSDSENLEDYKTHPRIQAQCQALHAVKRFLTVQAPLKAAQLTALFTERHLQYHTKASFLACLAKHVVVTSSLSPYFAWLKKEEANGIIQQEEKVLAGYLQQETPDFINQALSYLIQLLQAPLTKAATARLEAMLTLMTTELAALLRNSSDKRLEVFCRSPLRYEAIHLAKQLPTSAYQSNLLFMLEELAYCKVNTYLTEVNYALTKSPFTLNETFTRAMALNLIPEDEKAKIREALAEATPPNTPSPAYEQLCAWAGFQAAKKAEPGTAPAITANAEEAFKPAELADVSSTFFHVMMQLNDVEELNLTEADWQALQQDGKQASPALKTVFIDTLHNARYFNEAALTADKHACLDKLEALMQHPIFSLTR